MPDFYSPPLAELQSELTHAEASQNLIRPVGAYALHGITVCDQQLLAIDALRGYLLRIDPTTSNATIINGRSTEPFLDATGIALWEDTLWVARGHELLSCSRHQLEPQLFTTLPYPINGVAVWGTTLYVTCQKAGYIFVLNRETGRQITKFPAPGIGVENITVWEEYLWLCDQTEQTVYCLDRATGDVLMSVLTPFASPTGIAVLPNAKPDSGKLWVAYTFEEPYIRDDPNSENPHQLTFRDRTFIHALQFCFKPANNCTLSNRYLLEMCYVEEIAPLDELQLNQLEWRMALPATTDRQAVRHVEPIGLPFTLEHENGQSIAVFKFDQLHPHESHIFGWKALIEVGGIKYQLTPRQLEKSPPLSTEFRQRYLIDDDELAMDTPLIQAAAREAVGTETNLLRQVLRIRNYVYDRLSYGIRPRIDTPDVVLERGIGSCGEYVGLLLALCRLNGIACRTVGRYKCPPHADRLGILLEPDFNHVWIEFYAPGFGWLPMESNVDDIIEGGPYPTRFFMGLPWYHIEMSKEISFERLQAAGAPEVRLGDLAINHVRFRILQELPLMPTESPTQ
ncbi:transglutaminase domain-containing protein [Almyronema epifaneia]|uniref:Transglutaminase domain-containing protein n=1 Tax=Almyronema epifaneia S1 TaxID=2991925 RepID=A0ABW6IAB4_9CYAN